MEKDRVLVKLAEHFLSLFAGLDRAHGTYNIPTDGKTIEGEKVQGRPYTEHKPVTADLWYAHLAGTKGIGIIPITDQATVHWAAIDVDTYPLDLKEMEEKLTALNLPLVICRSKSGGAHLLLFCREPIKASLVRTKLAEWACAVGYPSAEIFPKQNSLANKTDVGNWLNMPYFNVKDTNRYALLEGKKLKVKEFLELAESRKVTADALRAFSLTALGGEEFEQGPPCLQFLAGKGFPRGSRNISLFNLAVFARFAFEDDWKEKVDEYNRSLMDPPLATSEVMNTLKSAGRKSYFFTCDKDPIASVCNKEVCRTRKYGIGGNSDASIAPIMLGAMTKINSDPPIWIIDVEGYRIEITTEDLVNQTRFRKLCMDKINKLPAMLRQPVWEAAIRDRLNNIEVVEAPPDSGPEGQFRVHLETFLTQRAGGNNLDELIMGKPFHCEKDVPPLTIAHVGRTFFRSPDLIRYLEQQHFREFKERQIWALLRKTGAEHHGFTLKGKYVTAWSVLSFAAQNEEFAVPTNPDGDMM